VEDSTALKLIIAFGIFGLLIGVAAAVGYYLERRERRGPDRRCFRCGTLGGKSWTQIHSQWFCESCGPALLKRRTKTGIPIEVIVPGKREKRESFLEPVN